VGGLIGRVLSFARVVRDGSFLEDVKIKPGGRQPLTPEHTSSPGDDAPPLSSDYAVAVPTEGTGRASAVGYVDPVNEGKAAPGEKRLYSRDPNGVVQAEVHLKGDGSVEVKNSAGTFLLTAAGSLQATVTTISIGNGSGAMSLDAGGTWNFNGLTITPAGDVITALGRSLDVHTHAAGSLLDSVPLPVTGVTGP
jgi:hypothetical protein